MNRRNFLRFVILSTLALVSCNLSPAIPRSLDLYPTETVVPTQTQRVIVREITSTPALTQTPNVVIVSATPNSGKLCVSAYEAVYLRPSPNMSGSPIEALLNGTQVIDLGGRDGEWIFVQVNDKQGWVNQHYLTECN